MELILFLFAVAMVLAYCLHEFVHVHKHDKPILSRYVDFYHRNIIYECRCGKRKSKKKYFRFSEPMPIQTDWVTDEMYETILNNKTTSNG